MKKQLSWVVIVVLGLALVGQYIYGYSTLNSQSVVHAAYPPMRDFKEVVDKADTIVEGEVVRVEAGPDEVVQLAEPRDEPGGVDRIPSQRVTIRVRNTDKGTASAGQEIVVHRVGGQLQYPAAPQRGSIRGKDNPETLGPPPGQVGDKKPNPDSPAPQRPAHQPDPNAPAGVQVKNYDLEGDPAYQVGDRVYLALQERPNEPGIKQPVHPAGRYLVRADGRLQGVADDDVSRSVNGRDIAEVRSAGRGERQIPNVPQGQQRVSTGEEPGMPRTGAEAMFDSTNPALFMWIGMGFVILGIVLGLVSYLPRRRRS